MISDNGSLGKPDYEIRIVKHNQDFQEILVKV